MKKRLLSLLLCFALIAGIFTAFASGEIYADGYCGDDIEWTLDETGVLTLSGTGPMYDYASEADVPWYDFKSMITEVIIGDGITRIGNYAFIRCELIENATLGNTIETIGYNAFSYCKSLSEIEFPNSVKTLENECFYTCIGLTSIDVPDSVTSLGADCFRNCKNVSRVSLPDTITTIPKNAFMQCEKLSDIIIPNSVTTIGDLAFCYCFALKKMVIPDSVVNAGRGIFSSCNALEQVTIPASWTTIPDDTFWQCKLGTFAISPNVTTIGNDALNSEYITSVIMPASVKTLGDGVFSNKLKTVYYGGTASQLNQITLGYRNEPFQNATKNYVTIDTITYNYQFNGGTSAEKSVDWKVRNKDYISFSYDATKPGWKFVGWNTDPYAKEECSNWVSNGNRTVYAIFSKDLIARLYSGENNLQETKTASMYNNETEAYVDAPEPAAYGNWTPGGWTASETSFDWESDVYIEKSKKLYAIYYRPLKITYDANGGYTDFEYDEQEQRYNASGKKEEITFTLSDPIERPGYIFNGWALGSEDGEVYDAGSQITLSEDTTMYATWEVDTKTAAPVISENDILGGKDVEITCATDDATIYYTTDGTEPSKNSNVYSSPIILNTAGTTTIKAFAVKSGFDDSSVKEKTITVERVETPVASLKGGTITSAKEVELSCSTQDAEIYYTINGAYPSTNSDLYSGVILIKGTTTLKAVAMAYGYANSACMVEEYTYQEPIILPPTVSTKDATSITRNTAVLNGKIDDDGGETITSKQFVYWNKHDTSTKYTVSANSDFAATVNNLTPASTYYYYAKATSAAGTGSGDIKTFNTTEEDKPQTVSITPSYVSIKEGETTQLIASVLPATAANRNVVWSSSDSSIASVDKNGKVKGIREGMIIITATTEVGRLKATCTVNVGSNSINGTFDFSEWNMATNTSYYAEDGFDTCTATQGGNYTMATAYLARWDGAVQESNDSYPSYNGNPSALYRERESDYHVQEVIWLPKRTSFTDNDEIKNAIVKYGAVYGSYLVNWNYYTDNKTNYYFPDYGSGSVGGHAVAIIGWDDNYPASKFGNTPPGNGAFICKNSYGPNSGENGFFYISYYDKYIGIRSGCAAVTSLERNTNYNKIYQYDPLGAVATVGYYKNSIYGANIFPQKGQYLSNDEILRAVSFYTYEKNTSYEVFVIENYNSSNSLSRMGTAVATGTIEEMGYHTIKLNSAVELKAGTRFAVVVKLSVSSGNARVFLEYPVSGYSSEARANSDESYYSSNGTSWTDAGAGNNANICIKAFTDNGYSSYSTMLFSGVNNSAREYESDKVYTLDEALENDWGINKDYVDYVKQQEYAVSMLSDGEENGMGEVPNIVDIGDNTVSFVEGAILPSRYDLRTENAVTAVRNQGSWGTCWAHATYASLESNLLKKAKSVSSAFTGDTADNDFITDVNQIGILPMGVTLSDEVVVIAKGSEYRLTANIEPANATEKDVVWSSSDESVITIDTNGRITALKTGGATITCKTLNGEYSAQCTVMVNDGEPVSSVSLETDSLTKAIGDVFLLDYVINPTTAINTEVKWSSDNEEVVSVNENGLITALSLGTAKVTIETKDGGFKDTVTVTVDDGMDCETVSITPNLTKVDPHYFGSVEITVKNKTDITKNAIVIVAVHDENGKLVATMQADEELYSGENPVTFNNVILSNVGNSKCNIKCYVWDLSMSPLASVADKDL